MQWLPVAVSGSVRTLAVIQQSDSISDDGDVRHGQPPRVSVLRRWLWAGQCITVPYCCRSSHASTYCTLKVPYEAEFTLPVFFNNMCPCPVTELLRN